MNLKDDDSLIVAIDGPAASGKSTVARGAAGKLDCLFVNSGSMYRAFTWWVLRNEIAPSDTEAIVELLSDTAFTCGEEEGCAVFEVQGRRLSPEQLRSDAVNDAVSAIAAISEVRSRLVIEQRKLAEKGRIIMEGRDIGTVVFPETPYKFYIDADPKVREQRRSAEGIEDSVKERDRADSARKSSPLKIADDAMVIDSTSLNIEEVITLVVDAIRH